MKISVESILNDDSLKLKFNETVNPSEFHVSIKNRRTGKFHRIGVVLENYEVVLDYPKIAKLDSITDEEPFTRFDVFAIDEQDVKYRIGVPESFEENLHEKVEIFKNEFAGNVRLYKTSSRELSLEVSVIYLPFVSNIVESNVQVTVPPTMRNHEFTYYFEQKNEKKKLTTEKFESFSIIDFSKLSPSYGDGKLSVVIKNNGRTRIRTAVFVGDKEVASIDDDRVVEFLPNENDRLEIRITKRIRFTAQSINSHDIHFEAIDSLTDRPVQFGFAMKQRSTNLPLLQLPSIDNQIQGSDIDDVLANNLLIDGVVDFYYYDKNESFNFDNKSLEEQLEYVRRIPVIKFNTIRSIKIDRIVGYSLYTTVNNKLSLRVDPININKISQPKVDIIDDYLVFSGDVADSELLLRDKNKVNVLLPVVNEKVSLQKIIALSGEYGYNSPFALYLRFGSKTVARLSNYDVTDDDSHFADIVEMPTASDSIYNQAAQIITNDDLTLSLKLGSRHNLQRAQYGISTKITNFLTTEQGYHFEATVSANNPESLQLSEALMINRNKLSYQEVPVDTTIQYNDNTLEFMVSVDVKPSESIQPIYQDMFIKATYENNDLLIKLNGTSKTVKNYVGNNIFEHEHDVLVNDVDAEGKEITVDHMMYPYITVGGNLAFEFRKRMYFENNENHARELKLVPYGSALYSAKVKYLPEKRVWVVFEKDAQGGHDNGFHFFKYVYEKHPEIDIYYVIEPESADYHNLKPYVDKVLHYMSDDYFITVAQADLLISSDTKFHVYNPNRRNSPLGTELAKRPLIYLQHGVNGLKQVPAFHKDRGLLKYIMAPTQYEKDNINVKQWGYSSDEVSVTGLARWDSYVDKSSSIDYKQIFVMPTWRKWMDGMSHEQFEKTPFFKEYTQFLNSKKLKKALKANNARLAFFLHPYFKDYVDLFDIDDSVIDKYGYLDKDMGEAMMESSLMVTDYSSVAWDELYLDKPVIFFQFDQTDYLQTEKAYLDYDTELFGETTFSADETIDSIIQYMNDDYELKPKYQDMRQKYFTYIDHNNSARIFDAVTGFEEQIITN